jgi:hypothetical protein
MRLRAVGASVALVVLAGCAAIEAPPGGFRRVSAEEGRALVERLLPPRLADRAGWATDLYAALAALDVPATSENICAVIAVAEQESGLRVDPPVPGLPSIARRELDARRERAGVPKLVLDAVLALPSSNGTRYGERLDAVKTEGDLSALYEDFIDRVPLARTFFADRNPVHTGGPMQVSVAFAEAQIEAGPYPYPLKESVRHEVFTRRGGLYFGVAHLLDYRASYDRYLYRFADFNAGRYASRNAAFQRALTQASGVPLALDGALVRFDDGRPAREPGSTELAARVVARRLGMSDADIRRDLERGREESFERTALYERVFRLADALERGAPRAVLPDIELHSPKITRRLTTAWFANRVDERFAQCLRRRPA